MSRAAASNDLQARLPQAKPRVPQRCEGGPSNEKHLKLELPSAEGQHLIRAVRIRPSSKRGRGQQAVCAPVRQTPEETA